MSIWEIALRVFAAHIDLSTATLELQPPKLTKAITFFRVSQPTPHHSAEERRMLRNNLDHPNRC